MANFNFTSTSKKAFFDPASAIVLFLIAASFMSLVINDGGITGKVVYEISGEPIIERINLFEQGKEVATNDGLTQVNRVELRLGINPSTLGSKTEMDIEVNGKFNSRHDITKEQTRADIELQSGLLNGGKNVVKIIIRTLSDDEFEETEMKDIATYTLYLAIQTPKNNCVDSDGGDNPNVYGELSGTDKGGNVISQTDQCGGGTATVNDVFEKICTQDSYTYTQHHCEYGCEKGVCKPAPAAPIAASQPDIVLSYNTYDYNNPKEREIKPSLEKTFMVGGMYVDPQKVPADTAFQIFISATAKGGPLTGGMLTASIRNTGEGYTKSLETQIIPYTDAGKSQSLGFIVGGSQPGNYKLKAGEYKLTVVATPLCKSGSGESATTVSCDDATPADNTLEIPFSVGLYVQQVPALELSYNPDYVVIQPIGLNGGWDKVKKEGSKYVVKPNMPLSAVYEVKNNDVKSVRPTVGAYLNDQYMKDWSSVQDIPPGQKGKITVELSGQRAGTYMLKVRLGDQWSTPLEIVAKEETLSPPDVDPKQVIEPLPTGFLQQSKDVTFDTLTENQAATMRVRIKNVYSQPKMLTVRFYVDGKESGSPKFTNTLQAGFQEIVQLSVPALSVGKHVFTVQVDDYYNQIFEATVQKSQEVICKDSDGGEISDKKGTIIGTYFGQPNNILTFDDTCESESKLREYFCDRGLYIGYAIKDCLSPNKCVDGACVVQQLTIKPLLSLRAPVEGVFYQNGKAVPVREGYAQVVYNGGPVEAKLIIQNTNVYPAMTEAISVLVQYDPVDRNPSRWDVSAGMVEMNQQKDIVIPLTSLNPGKQILVADIKETKLGRMTEESRRVTAKFNVIYAECPQGTTREVDGSCVPVVPIVPVVQQPVAPVVPVVVKNTWLEINPKTIFAKNTYGIMSPDRLPNVGPIAQFYARHTGLENYKAIVDIMIYNDKGDKVNAWKKTLWYDQKRDLHLALIDWPLFPKDGKYKLVFELQPGEGETKLDDNKVEFFVTVVNSPLQDPNANVVLESTIIDQAGAVIPVDGNGPITLKTTLKNVKLIAFTPMVRYVITDKNNQVVYDQKVTFDSLPMGATKQFSAVGPDLKQGDHTLVSEVLPDAEPSGKQDDNKRTLQFSVKPAVGQLPLVTRPKITFDYVEWYQDNKLVRKEAIVPGKQTQLKVYLKSDAVGEFPLLLYLSEQGTTYKTVDILPRFADAKMGSVTVIASDNGYTSGYHKISLVLEGKDSTGKKVLMDTVLYQEFEVKATTTVAPLPPPVARYDYAITGVQFNHYGAANLQEPKPNEKTWMILQYKLAEFATPESTVKVVLDGKVVYEAYKVRQLLGKQDPRTGVITDEVDIEVPNFAPGKHTIEVIADPKNELVEKDENNNKFTKTVAVYDSGMTDLMIGLETRSYPQWIYQDQYLDQNKISGEKVVSARVYVTSTNKLPSKFTVIGYVDDKEVKRITDELSNFNGYDRTWFLDLGKIVPGRHTFKARVETDKDMNLVNNEVKAEITVMGPAPVPVVQPTIDFALGDFVYYKQGGNTYPDGNALDPSSELIAEVHVILDEDEVLPPAVMKVLVDGKVIQQSFALPQQPQAYRPSGRIYSNVEVPLGKQASGRHEIEFILDPEKTVSESSETNNALKAVFTVRDAERPDVVLKAIVFGGDNGIVHFQQDDRRRPATDLVPAQDTTVQVEAWNVGEAAVEKPVVVAKLDGVEIARKEMGEALPARQQGTKRVELALGKLPSGTHTLTFELPVENDKHQDSNKDFVAITVQSPSASTENEHIYFDKGSSQAVFDDSRAKREGKNTIELKLHLVNSNDQVIGPIPLIIKFGGETIKRDVMLSGRHNFHTEEFSVDRRVFPTKIVAIMDIKDNSPSDNMMKLPVVLKKDGKMYTLN